MKKGRNTLYVYIGAALLALGLVSAGTVLYGAVVADISGSSREVASSSLEAAAALVQSKKAKGFSQMGVPKTLNIPSLGINTEILEVGVTSAGNMATPKSFSKVGWYKYGSVPGNAGSAVIAGHVDNGLSLAGVFKHLKDIKVGDLIQIVDENGATSSFRVSSTERLDYTTENTAEIFATQGSPQLRLITCEGEWVPEKKTYSERLVVTADRVE